MPDDTRQRSRRRPLRTLEDDELFALEALTKILPFLADRYAPLWTVTAFASDEIAEREHRAALEQAAALEGQS